LKPTKRSKPNPKPRPRNSAATRAAILASARRAFARAGYDGAGTREIAAGAGVTAMLVNRYFGSKEQLFAEVLAEVASSPTILAADNLGSTDLAGAFASALVDITRADATPLEGFLIMMYSAASPTAAELGRAQILRSYLPLLASRMRGANAEQRAALILALVAGVQVMRQIIALPPLADAEPKQLAKQLAPLFARLLEP
jgi:AcrR family transcriptional regulator